MIKVIILRNAAETRRRNQIDLMQRHIGRSVLSFGTYYTGFLKNVSRRSSEIEQPLRVPESPKKNFQWLIQS